MSTMQAVVAHGPDDLRIDTVKKAEAGPRGILVRVAFGGICGSDLHYFKHGRNGVYVLSEPLVLGHEIVGTIAEVGIDVVGSFPIGTPVAIHPAYPTPAPGTNEARGTHLATGGSYLGSASTTPHTQGGFAEFLTVNPDQIRPLPDNLPLRRAALAEPFAVALHGVSRAGDVADARVLVSGSGPIGCLAVAALRLAGAAEIIATDLTEVALRVADAAGATGTSLITPETRLEEESFDIVVEASGSSKGLATALSSVKRGGTIVQLGMLPSGNLPIPLSVLVNREITLRGSQRFELELDEAVRLLPSMPELDAIVTHVLPLSDAKHAFELALDGAVSSKVLLSL